MNVLKSPLRLALFATTAIAVFTFQNTTPSSAADVNDPNRPIYIADSTGALEHINVVGSRVRQREIPGSAVYLGPEELETFEYADINRILRQIPGVNIQEEDGFGLRPNIGIRGTGIERSERITLMEDGVLIAPAPYAAPAAYYFPTAARMSAIEVRKGSSAIKFGPRTIGGAINLVSTPIPEESGGFLNARAGNFGFAEAHASAGGESGQLAFNLEGVYATSNGFKELPNDGDTGFRLYDFVGKVRWSSDASSTYKHFYELKVGFADQISNETYLGLTDADFAANPFQRYAASQLDRFESMHEQIQLLHHIEFSNSFDLTSIAYYNTFERDWYKLDDLNFGDGRGRISPNNVFSDPSNPLNITALAILRGNTDSVDDALQLKHNAREYYSLGFQTIAGYSMQTGDARHDIELGIRYHQDEEDRLQHRENYAMRSGALQLTSVDNPGSNANRVSSAKALALFVQDEIKYGNWRIVPGLRFEHINLYRDDYSTTDPQRSNGPTRQRQSTVDVLIPGIGVSYDISESISALAGVHKGFSPPGPANSNQSSEVSVNYETGIRYNANGVELEAIAFYTDYSNLLGTCSNATGCNTGDIGDQFNGGDVDIIGLEMSVSQHISLSSNLWIPLRFAYTYSNAEFKSSFTDGFWGSVTSGDKLPYIPSQQINAIVGLASTDWDISAAVNYVSETRATAGSGAIAANDLIDGRLVIDMAASYQIMQNAKLFASIDNVFDNTYVVARRPYGARPGKPRSFYVGLKLSY